MGRTAAAALACLAACSSPTEKRPPPDLAPPDRLGEWGEDPALAPDFALAQERRAPKLPDVDDRMRERPHTIAMERLDAGVLLCKYHVREPAPDRRWDALAPPDLAFQLIVGRSHPIRFWGPEDHHDAYVSVPRLTIARGDLVRLDGWDRDVTSDEYIGGDTARFDGEFPLHFRSTWMDADCTAMTHAEAEAVARPMLADIDRALARIEAAEPDEAKPDLGGDPYEIDHLRGMFKVGGVPLRYAAGALGWEDPAIQARLARLRAGEAAWRAKRARTVEEIASRAPPPGTAVEIAKGLTMRVAATSCERGGCRFTVESSGRLADFATERAGVCTGRVAVGMLRGDGAYVDVQAAPPPGATCTGALLPAVVLAPAGAGARPRLLEVVVGDRPPIRLRLE